VFNRVQSQRFINKIFLLSYMEITKISSKGQVVIPIRIRNQLNIDEGSVLAVDTTNDMVILKRIDVDLVGQFKNSLEDLKKGKMKRVA